MNLEILVEERSDERALDVLLPRIVPGVDFEIRVFRGKVDLLKKLPDRIKGYSDFVDVPALRMACSRVPVLLAQQAKYRDPDAIIGGACEALERVLQAYGYHPGSLAKVVAATEIAQHMNVDVNRSRSFQVFRDGVRRLVAGGTSAAQN